VTTKARYDQLANSVGFQGDSVAISNYAKEREDTEPASLLGRPVPGHYRINVICRIRRHTIAKMMIVHLDRLATYLGASRDDQP
jgi:hypothetical protein